MLYDDWEFAITPVPCFQKGKDCGTCTQQTHQRFSCNAGGMHEISDQASAYFCVHRKRQSC